MKKEIGGRKLRKLEGEKVGRTKSRKIIIDEGNKEEKLNKR